MEIYGYQYFEPNPRRRGLDQGLKCLTEMEPPRVKFSLGGTCEKVTGVYHIERLVDGSLSFGSARREAGLVFIALNTQLLWCEIGSLVPI